MPRKQVSNYFKLRIVVNIFSIANLGFQKTNSHWNIFHQTISSKFITILYHTAKIFSGIVILYFFLKCVRMLTCSSVFIYALILFPNLNFLNFGKLKDLHCSEYCTIHLCNLKILLPFVCSQIFSENYIFRASLQLFMSNNIQLCSFYTQLHGW